MVLRMQLRNFRPRSGNSLQISLRQNFETIANAMLVHSEAEFFQKGFAFDVTSSRHLMVHQMRNVSAFSVFHSVEGAVDAAFNQEYPSLKKRARSPSSTSSHW